DPQADGEVLEVELEDDDEAFVYEIKLLAPDGRIMERRFDAHTGEPLGAAREDD
ncbi:MAG: PepSY domain-containing protein, partial [Rhodospirillaceae bacterium]|nr:PepSY domain-containing protein [Rhodospirillaceae bacterium]